MQTTIEKPKKEVEDVVIRQSSRSETLLPPSSRTAKKGKITLYVRSRTVNACSQVVSLPLFTGGLSGSGIVYGTERVVIQENVLGKEDKEALENYKAVARNLGVKLEVKDLGQANVFTRLLNFLGAGKAPRNTPSVSVAGEALQLLTMRTSEKVPGEQQQKY